MSEIRKKRALTQNISVLETIYSANNDYRAYLIEGTTGNQYDVAIRANPWCSCMDFELHKTRCKHIYYVLLKLLKAKNVDKETYSKEDLVEMFTGKSPKPIPVAHHATIEKLPTVVPQQATNVRLPVPKKPAPVPLIPQPKIVQLPTMSPNIWGPNTWNFMEKLSSVPITTIESPIVPVESPIVPVEPTAIVLQPYIEQITIGVAPEEKMDIEVTINKNINLDNIIVDPAEFKVEPEPVPTELVFENTVTNKFKFMHIGTDVFTTICGYIKEHYGPFSRDNAIKLYESNASIESIMKDDAFSGVYLTKVHDALFELHIKTITKINAGWVFSKYVNNVKTEKIARFFTVNN